MLPFKRLFKAEINILIGIVSFIYLVDCGGEKIKTAEDVSNFCGNVFIRNTKLNCCVLLTFHSVTHNFFLHNDTRYSETSSNNILIHIYPLGIAGEDKCVDLFTKVEIN